MQHVLWVAAGRGVVCHPGIQFGTWVLQSRGVYSGAVGYIGFDGDMNVAIAIRTAVIKNQTLFVQAGAGIVSDSIPINEWVETQNKAKAILKAAELVQARITE